MWMRRTTIDFEISRQNGAYTSKGEKMRVKNTLAQAGFAAICAISLSTAVSGTAMAGSVTYPGELVGISFAPLPEGVYAVNTSSFANDRAVGDKSSIYVDIPVIAWSTPWTFLGGRVEAYVAGPFVGVYAPGVYTNDFYNPFVAVGEAWDLGHGFYVAEFVGSYLPIDNFLGQNYFTPNNRFAIGYTGDGWDLTAHTTFGLRTNDISTSFGDANPMVAGTHGYDYFNLDLTATKKLGKWEVGPVAFGSWDVGSASTPGTGPHQGQFAVGGLVGYDFGGLYGQVYMTHDVWIHNYASYETNIFGRIIIPLWNPPAPPKPLVSKY
jgi:Putative MetA-pathway of phenol degradation